MSGKSSVFSVRVCRSKQGQSELIGLVIIVILLTLGMLFLARFALTNQDVEKSIFTRKGLAYSSMSAVMKTQAICEDPRTGEPIAVSVGKELIDDCAENFESTSDLQCNGMHSCEFIESSVSEMLTATLGAWNKQYLFQSVLLRGETREELVEISVGNCANSNDRDSSGLFPIFVTDVGLVENVLLLCD